MRKQANWLFFFPYRKQFNKIRREAGRDQKKWVSGEERDGTCGGLIQNWKSVEELVWIPDLLGNLRSADSHNHLQAWTVEKRSDRMQRCFYPGTFRSLLCLISLSLVVLYRFNLRNRGGRSRSFSRSFFVQIFLLNVTRQEEILWTKKK